QDEDLQREDLVLTSGSAGTYPPDLLIGKVEEIEKKENQLFQEATLSMFWEIKELNDVFVLKWDFE
ncbi:MAG: rod shape-determining protein MreC, partial [Candidatus Cloacimonetes bacterium]|nr:rod shape-determining protein MreC [Candidatus Cloacimonadota bacterium]